MILSERFQHIQDRLQIGLGKDVTFDDLGDLRDGKGASEGSLHLGEQQVIADGDPGMDLDSAL